MSQNQPRENHAIVTFSHLRWNFVYQRPQQLLARLAKHWRILFVEEPVHGAPGETGWEIESPAENVLVCRPHTSVASSGFSDEQIPYLQPLLKGLIDEHGSAQRSAWFYTPMALPLLAEVAPSTVIYDCMDELSAFLNAPPQLVQRENELLKLADIVFTGGPSLFRAKRDRHPSVHCFPSSVDRSHFGHPAPEPLDQANLPAPRLGFYGVIDERIDLDLLSALADAHPEWQIVMVGPVVKIDPGSLPQRGNMHYLGQRKYEELPAYLHGWDVCLLPFALNDATRFISPTKTLEYMAAEKPIVSTPIRDVEEPYSEIVYLGGSPASFVKACETALRAPGSERQERTARMRSVLSVTSWDATADAMKDLITEAPNRRKTRRSSENRPVVIAGAGPTGLSAAFHLGQDALLLEQHSTVGGWCRSIEDNGFTFDYAGHIMFSNEPYVHQMYQMLLGDNIHWQDREAWIHSKGVYTRYPFQGSLYGLPAPVIKECVLGAIEARFGSLKKGGSNGANGKAKANGVHATASSIKDCCADGVLESSVHLCGTQDTSEPKTFEEFIHRVWGAGIAKHFAIPYNRKLWAVPLNEMETSWLGGRVPLPDLGEMIEGALQPSPKPMGPNARFGYPLRGGFQALMNGFLPHLRGELRLNTRVAGVSPKQRRITLADGSHIGFEYLISTMPLPVLVRLMGDEAPRAVREAAAGLRYVSVRCVNIGVNREKVTDKHWIYYPEDTVFHRIFVQGNASPYCNPPGGFGFTCEITYSPQKPLPADGAALIDRCVADCRRVAFLRPDDTILTANQVDLPHAYVVYDHARRRNVETIRAFLSRYDVLLAGRYSEWEYYNSDHAFVAGRNAAQQVRDLQREKERMAPPLLVAAEQGVSY